MNPNKEHIDFERINQFLQRLENLQGNSIKRKKIDEKKKTILTDGGIGIQYECHRTNK